VAAACSFGAAAEDTKSSGSQKEATKTVIKTDLEKIPDKVSQLLQDRQYAEAVAAIEAATKASEAARDYLGYLKARALFLQQKYDEAVAAYQQVEKDYPTSNWGHRAKFGRAVALARKGDFRSAELIYREEAERLLSADRKQEIAELYLEFASAFFKPADEILQKPDYAKALEFYNKALEVGPKPDTRVEVELRVARCFQELGNQQEAANRYKQFVKDHAGVPQEVEARFRLGEVQMAMNQPTEARRTWQDLIAAHADDKSERIAEATFNLSQTYGLPSPGNAEMLNLGVASLENFLKLYPDHKLAGQAHLRIAESYLNTGRHADAVKALDKFLTDKRYADREELADARNLIGRAYQLQKKFPEALAAWRDYLAKHPAHHDWSQVQQEIINTEYMLANEKSAAKQYDEARKLWTEFMAKYPLDGRNPRIMYLFGAMNYEQEKWDEAIADWRRLVSKYPGTNEASQGQFMIARTTETKLDKLEDALKEYRKVNWGSFAAAAGNAAKRLTSKTLAIRTERVFRTNETAKIKLMSRNIDTVTVRAYKVDLETYFRKMHAVGGVEGLDIALIDPDKTFEFKVPKYAEYQQLESEIEVPLVEKAGAGQGGPAGVMAVTVSGKTLEATTLVMQSDMDVVLKSSRDEVFVFAENMRTGKPWPNARLLVSNGQAVFAEGKTGDDGVFQKSFKELKDAANVRVFAAAEGSFASNLVDLSGVGVAQGLADKAYIYTDRPAYRAGQLVHVRGVLRKAADDAYVIETDKKYTVEVFDGRNRSIWQNDVKLS
jgi:tetratricopeptide (TPR) repeat protein